MKIAVIVGTSRKGGDTDNIVAEITELTHWDLIHLSDYNFSYYDYEHQNKDDDFIPLMKILLDQYDLFIFATPVYWYSMSGIMKVFFDRITDLLTIEKELGHKLRGKKMAVLSCSIGNHLDENFWLPFSETANYLDMVYCGHLHTIAEEDNSLKISAFIEEIRNMNR